MRVRAISGEPFRFFVQSDADPEQRYLVDLQANGQSGWCGCQDFEFRRELARREKHPDPEEARCKHIKAARNFLLDDLMSRIAKALRMPEEKLLT